ncbi:Stomatal closure-related actin-binding protein 2, partial [Bienertia sinuspersici]
MEGEKNYNLHFLHIPSEAAFIRQVNKSIDEVSKQKKSGLMSTFLEKQQQELVHKKQQEQPDQKQKLLEKLQKQQQLQKLQHPQLQKQQPQLQNQQQQVQKQQHQPLQQSNQQTFPKKQQDMRFCSPGSLSAYRNLRKKQVQNIEHPSNDEVEYGGQPMSINASGMVLEREAENEVQPMIETDNVAHEREAETMIEGSSEAPKIKKHRGPTKKTDIHARTLEERTPIILNCYGQPIGPTPKDVKDLSRFLGTIARTTEFAPLNYVDWPSVPTHDQIWEYVLEKFMIPPEGRSWVLETVNLSWRGYKSKLKKMYLEAVEKGSNLDEPEDELKDLISYWNTSPAKEQSKKNKRNRKKLDDMHTMGPSSYAALRHKLKQEDPNKQEPSKAKVYRESRIRNPKKTYKTSYGNTKANM